MEMEMGSPAARPKGGRCSRSTICVLCLLVCGAGFGAFLLIRMNVQNCGCPVPEVRRRLQGQSDQCPCEGDVFQCKYQCSPTECYSGGEEVSCADLGWIGPPSPPVAPLPPAQPGTVYCTDSTGFAASGPGGFCNCGSDCGNDQDPHPDNDYCTCPEAQASTCCGTSGR